MASTGGRLASFAGVDDQLSVPRDARRYPILYVDAPMLTSFTLTETHALGGRFTWRLKEGAVRYRGSHQFAGLVDQRVPASETQLAVFEDALDLLDVWSWRNNYDPDDVGWAVMEGSSWTFKAATDFRACRCGGANGYPSFADVSITTVDRGRYAMLLAAMYASFDIDNYVHIAQHRRQQAAESHG